MVEDGGWIQGGATGLDWHNVDTAGGFGFGPLGGVGGATDSIACRSGFTPNQWAQAVIHKSGTLTDYFEVELLLRWQITAHVARGYEINISHDGVYCQVVRWNGTLDSFDYVITNFSNQATPQDGDTFYAEISGNIVTVKLNGTLIGTVDVSVIGGTVWNTGDPGVGFFRGEPALSNLNANQFCYTSFSAGQL